MTWGDMQNVWVPIFSGQGHSVGPNPQKITSWSVEPFATKLGIVMHHHEPEWCVTMLDALKVEITVRVQIFRKYIICPQTVSSKPLLNLSLWNLVCLCIITTWGVIQSLGSYLQCQGRSVAPNPQTLILMCWTFCNQTWYSCIVELHHKPVMWQFWIAVVKVTVSVQILREYIICTDNIF